MSEGTIVTFYSYKGGVGRTFALANIGALLSLWGYKTLCVDWDLEAPGLHLYFKQWMKERNPLGLTDIIQAHVEGMKPEWQNYITEVHFSNANEPLLLMSAGLQDESYFQRMQTLDWSKLYESHNLGNFLEGLRESWKESLDFVLIDSRTGISDIGGICTVQLPDMLILLLTANDQSLYGSLDVLRSVNKVHTVLPLDRSNLLVMPVISRFEGRFEYALAQKWLATFAKVLAPILREWLPVETNILDLLNFTRIPYVPYWSFGEKLPVIEKGTEDPDDIGFPLESLAALLAQRLSGSEKLVNNRSLFVTEAKRGPVKDEVELEGEQPETDHTTTVDSLNNLAKAYRNQGRYEEAEPLLQRALAIREKTFGPDHPTMVTDLNNLAILYRDQGRYEEAEPLLQRALAISEKTLGPDYRSTAVSLNNLATLYRDQGKNEEAEPLFRRVLAIREKTFGPDHPTTVITLNNLAILYRDQGRYEEAEPLLQRALAISEKTFGPDQSSTAATLNNLATLYRDQGKNKEAEPLLRRALAISEKTFGPDHPTTAATLNNLGWIYTSMGRYKEAEPLLRRALAINEMTLSSDHPTTAVTLNNLGWIYTSIGRYKEAEPLLRRALAINEMNVDSDKTIKVLEHYIELLQLTQREEEAKVTEERLRALKTKYST